MPSGANETLFPCDRESRQIKVFVWVGICAKFVPGFARACPKMFGWCPGGSLYVACPDHDSPWLVFNHNFFN
jgi:hypothetical protein